MIQIPMHEPADIDCIYIVKTLERIWIRGSELAVPNVDHSVSMTIAEAKEAVRLRLTSPRSSTSFSVAGVIFRRAGVQSPSP